jgi:hypothetical protein
MSALDRYRSYIASKPMDHYETVHAARFHHTIDRCGEILARANSVLKLGGQVTHWPLRARGTGCVL